MQFFDKLQDYSQRAFSPHKRDIMYGRGALVREVCNFRFPRKINILFEHGIDAVQVDRYERDCDAKAYIVYSEQKRNNLLAIGKKNVHVVRDPFTYVVNPHFSTYDFYVNFQPAVNGRALYFYGHSTPDIDDQKPTDKYISIIKEQIETFGNCTVCLHFADVAKSVHHVLEKNNIDWISIPPLPRKSFPSRFYQMISNYEYFISNVPGSYLYYIASLNLPFKLIKEIPEYLNVSDSAQTKNFSGFFNEFPNDFAYDLFSTDFEKSRSAKQKFANQMLGYDTGSGISDDLVLIRKLLYL